MNPEKVAHFIALIDKALECVQDRRKKVESGEIDSFDFVFEGLDNFESTLYYLKRCILNNKFEYNLSRNKGHRPMFGMTYGVGEIGDALGERLFNHELTHALSDMEGYFDDELD